MPELTQEDVEKVTDSRLLKMLVINLQFAQVFTLKPYIDACMADYKTCEQEILNRMCYYRT